LEPASETQCKGSNISFLKSQLTDEERIISNEEFHWLETKTDQEYKNFFTSFALHDSVGQLAK